MMLKVLCSDFLRHCLGVEKRDNFVVEVLKQVGTHFFKVSEEFGAVEFFR